MSDKKKIILIDFDGVLHSYKSGWQGADVIPDAPVPGAIEWLEQLASDDRFDVQIFSSRNHQEGGVEAIFTWLLKNRLSFEAYRRIHALENKPAAHLSIDDRAFCFSGRFPSPDEIADFQPWWKGGQDRIAYLEERLHKADGMAHEINLLTVEYRKLEAENARLRTLLADKGVEA